MKKIKLIMAMALLSNLSHADLHINSSINWLSPTNYSGDLYIDNGGNLTIITNQTFPQNVYVQPGGTLNIVGSSTINFHDGMYMKVMTSHDPAVNGGRLYLQNCNITGGMWKGIFVVGDNTLPQSSAQMAKATLATGPSASSFVLIENANTALANYDYLNDYQANYTGGGIIQATGATIRNTQWCVDMKHYQNFNKNNPHTLYNDASYFKRCTFSKASVASNWQSGGLVSVHETEGIQFLANTFTVDASWGGKAAPMRGINCDRSGVIVSRNCNNMFCTSYTGNTFNNIMYGIYASNGGEMHRVSVDYNTFTNTQYGMYISGCNNPYLCRNAINMTADYSAQQIGIALEGTNQFGVMENNINVTNPGSNSLTYGITVKNSASAANMQNQVYHNTVNNCNYNLYADADNRWVTGGTNNSLIGLNFNCNNMQNSITDAYDIAIFGGTTSGSKGIAASQGFFIGGYWQSASNIFSTGLNTGHSILNNSNPITYYGTTSAGHSGTGITNEISNTTLNGCASLICDFPCAVYVDLGSTATALMAIKSTLTTNLQDTYGTDAFDAVLRDYEENIDKLVELYMGEPDNPDAVIDRDALQQILDEAILDLQNYTNKSVATARKKMLLNYHIKEAGLLTQKGDYDAAIQLLAKDKDQFILTEEEIQQTEKLITVLGSQKELATGKATWETLSSQGFIIDLAEGDELAAPYAQALVTHYTGKLFAPKLKTAEATQRAWATLAEYGIYPNPAHTLVNVPASTQSYTLMDMSGRVVLSATSMDKPIINIENLNTGVYFLEFTDKDHQKKSVKLIKN